MTTEGVQAGEAGEAETSGTGGSGGTAARPADGGTTSSGGVTSGSGTSGGGTMSGGSSGAGGGGSTEQEALEEIATGETEPYLLALDDRYVFWTSGDSLRRAPLSGGDVTTLIQGRALGAIATAGGYVYFSERSGNDVGRVSRDGGNFETLGQGVNPGGIAVEGSRLYWANGGTTLGSSADGTLASVSLDGSGAAILTQGLWQPTEVAADEGYVYFNSTASSCGSDGCFGGGVNKVPIEGGAPLLVDSEGIAGSVMRGEAGVYWILGMPARVKFAPRGGGAVQTLADLSGENPGPAAVDAEAVYLGSAGRVLKVPLDGSEPFPLVLDLDSTGDVAVDTDWAYVTVTSQGRVLRVRKDGSAAQPDGPITGPCPTPLGTAEAIAATPREDEDLELLAIALDAGEVTASQETYDRLTADVASIRNLEPSLADIGYFPLDDGKTLFLIPTETALTTMQAGLYSAWDCLNDFYGVTSLIISEAESVDVDVIVELKGNYAMDVLARVYAGLPGIERTFPTSVDGDGSTLCAARDGALFEYVVDRAGGPCPDGCTTHEAHHFRSTAPGVVEALEVWDSESVSAVPEWFARLCPN
jgi:hypothetical protein